jgi:hypothetical protein
MEFSISIDKSAQICWKDQWINPFESIISVIEKIRIANHVDKSDIIRFLGNEKVRVQTTLTNSEKFLDLYSMEGFDVYLFKKYTSFDIQKQRIFIKEVCKSNFYMSRLQENFSKYFRYCEICITNNFHSIFHQIRFLFECPFHGIELRDSCFKCNKSIYYKYKFIDDHFRCSCGYNLTGNSENSPIWKYWETGSAVIINEDSYINIQLGEIIHLLC